MDPILADIHSYLLETPNAQAEALQRLDPDDDLIALGIFDSLSLLDFVQFVEKRASVKIPGEDIEPYNFGSIAAIERYLGTRVPS